MTHHAIQKTEKMAIRKKNEKPRTKKKVFCIDGYFAKPFDCWIVLHFVAIFHQKSILINLGMTYLSFLAV